MGFEIGKTVAGYEVVEVLGSSKTGVAYKVRNVFAQRFEVLKVLPKSLQDDEEQNARFLREIKVHAQLLHPNIVTFYNAQEIQGQLVMTTEFVQGVTVEERLKAGPIAWRDAARYASQVLSALEYAHAHGVIHRGLSSSNLILTDEGLVRLTGFGLAKSSSDPQLTSAGVVIGALKYMAPEQVKGADVDERCDLYSLGIVLFEMLTGKLPFDGKGQFELMLAHVSVPPKHASDENADVPRELDDVVMKALAKEPDQRFRNAREFRNALDQIGVSREAKPEAATPVAAVPPVSASSVTESSHMVTASPAALATLLLDAPSPTVMTPAALWSVTLSTANDHESQRLPDAPPMESHASSTEAKPEPADWDLPSVEPEPVPHEAETAAIAHTPPAVLPAPLLDAWALESALASLETATASPAPQQSSLTPEPVPAAVTVATVADTPAPALVASQPEASAIASESASAEPRLAPADWQSQSTALDLWEQPATVSDDTQAAFLFAPPSDAPPPESMPAPKEIQPRSAARELWGQPVTAPFDDAQAALLFAPLSDAPATEFKAAPPEAAPAAEEWKPLPVEHESVVTSTFAGTPSEGWPAATSPDAPAAESKAAPDEVTPASTEWEPSPEREPEQPLMAAAAFASASAAVQPVRPPADPDLLTALFADNWLSKLSLAVVICAITFLLGAVALYAVLSVTKP